METWLIIETRDNAVTRVDRADSLENAISACLDAADADGYIPGITSREELEDRLERDRAYDDGANTISIRELAR